MTGEHQGDEPDEDDEDQGDEPDEDQGDEDGSRDPAGSRLARPVPEAAAMLLGLLAWMWVGLPLLQGGPKRAAAVLKAKLLNRAHDGSPLP